MSQPRFLELSRRERQIMDGLHRLGEGTVGGIREQLHDPPSYNSVRVTLSILERKGYVRHRRDGRRYVYRPTERSSRASTSALKHVLETFFGNSPSNVVSTLLDVQSGKLSEEELDELSELIEAARRARKRRAP